LFHVTRRRFEACQVSHVLEPTTTTAFQLLVASTPRLVPATTRVGITASMPDGVAGVAASVPPRAGLCRTTP
jgi:hypothetical protein